MVLCAIFGCGTQTVRDKRIYMARIPSVITNQGEEIRNLSEERLGETNAFLPSMEKTSKMAFWITDESGRHFISGKAAKLCDRYDPDWISKFRSR